MMRLCKFHSSMLLFDRGFYNGYKLEGCNLLLEGCRAFPARHTSNEALKLFSEFRAWVKQTICYTVMHWRWSRVHIKKLQDADRPLPRRPLAWQSQSA